MTKNVSGVFLRPATLSFKFFKKGSDQPDVGGLNQQRSTELGGAAGLKSD